LHVFTCFRKRVKSELARPPIDSVWISIVHPRGRTRPRNSDKIITRRTFYKVVGPFCFTVESISVTAFDMWVDDDNDLNREKRRGSVKKGRESRVIFLAYLSALVFELLLQA
jgi:hypothetical protein